MKISTKGRYAVRLMVDLAIHNTGEFISLKEISNRQEVSIKYLEQIVIMLIKSGLVKSVRGAQGGYRLARDPKDYTTGEILRAVMGSLAPIACLDSVPNQCPRADKCTTVNFWMGLDKAIADYVDGYTLENLLEEYKAKEAVEYFI